MRGESTSEHCSCCDEEDDAQTARRIPGRHPDAKSRFRAIASGSGSGSVRKYPPSQGFPERHFEASAEKNRLSCPFEHFVEEALRHSSAVRAKAHRAEVIAIRRLARGIEVGEHPLSREAVRVKVRPISKVVQRKRDWGLRFTCWVAVVPSDVGGDTGCGASGSGCGAPLTRSGAPLSLLGRIGSGLRSSEQRIGRARVAKRTTAYRIGSQWVRAGSEGASVRARAGR
jgi:hypothetical protein